jgi:hypothetical protein
LNVSNNSNLLNPTFWFYIWLSFKIIPSCGFCIFNSGPRLQRKHDPYRLAGYQNSYACSSWEASLVHFSGWRSSICKIMKLVNVTATFGKPIVKNTTSVEMIVLCCRKQ